MIANAEVEGFVLRITMLILYRKFSFNSTIYIYRNISKIVQRMPIKIKQFEMVIKI